MKNLKKRKIPNTSLPIGRELTPEEKKIITPQLKNLAIGMFIAEMLRRFNVSNIEITTELSDTSGQPESTSSTSKDWN